MHDQIGTPQGHLPAQFVGPGREFAGPDKNVQIKLYNRLEIFQRVRLYMYLK